MERATEVAVKVAVRVRPLSDQERLENQQSCIKVISSSNQLIIGRDKAFTFDHVFGTKSGQQEIYDNCVRDLVSGLFEGYNATVFAYGQTGSGKTYTIGGSGIYQDADPQAGIMPKAVETLYEHIKAVSETRTVKVKCSFIEIYKEELHDLLFPNTPTKDLQIREDDQGNTILTGIKEVSVHSKDDVHYCLKRGSLLRHTSSTGMNEKSSRSHAVFTICVEQSWMSEFGDHTGRSRPVTAPEGDSDGESAESLHNYISAKFHFVDLAGSERAHRTKNVGDRFKESVHINSGLLALGNVISALTDAKRKNTGHIPYRDSKITRLLKDSLGGNARTLMICCVSPALHNFDESLNSLNYAARARSIQNKPIVNRNRHEKQIEAMKTEIEVLRAELERQKTQMMQLRPQTQENETSMSQIARGSNRASDSVAISTVNELQDKIRQLSEACSRYKLISQEAYRQLVDIKGRQLLSSSLDHRFDQWLGLIGELQSAVPDDIGNIDQWTNATIKRLEIELDKCKEHLQFDEEIFAERAAEIEDLKQRCNELQQYADHAHNDNEEKAHLVNSLQHEIVQKQVEIEQLQARIDSFREQQTNFDLDGGPQFPHRKSVSINVNSVDILGASHDSLPTPRANRRPSTRAKSVPVSQHKGGLMSARPVSRHIHTSPALFSVERVMQGFRARAALLLGQLDDGDHVPQLQPIAEESESNTPAIVRRQDTYNKSEAEPGVIDVISGDNSSDEADNGDLRRSLVVHKQEIKHTDSKQKQLTEKMKELDLNIKLKEQLIRDLVKTGRENENTKKVFEEKIQKLQTEKQAANQKMKSLQEVLNKQQHTAVNHSASNGTPDRNTEKVKIEYESQLESLRNRVSQLKRRQREMEKSAQNSQQNEKKLEELRLAVSNMKQQQKDAAKKMKAEQEVKMRLEKELLRDQSKLKKLQITNEKQEKVIREKTQRQLRSAGGDRPPAALTDSAQNRIASSSGSQRPPPADGVRLWLDEQLETLSSEKLKLQRIEKQEQQLRQLLEKREAILNDRSKLEMRVMRLSFKQRNRPVSGDDVDAVARVTSGNDEGQSYSDGAQADALQTRLEQYDSNIQALDAAIAYSEENIKLERGAAQDKLNIGLQQVEQQLSALDPDDAKSILYGFFSQTVELKKQLVDNGSEASALRNHASKCDDQVQLMQSTLFEQQNLSASVCLGDGETIDQTSRVTDLEKELYYYKKASREMRKKLNSMGVSASQVISSATADISRKKSAENDASTHNSLALRSHRSPSHDKTFVFCAEPIIHYLFLVKLKLKHLLLPNQRILLPNF